MYLLILVVLSVLFAVTHIGMSGEPLRGKIVGRMGEIGFRAVYSMISIVTLGGAAWIFAGHRDMGPELWNLPWYLWFLPFCLMLAAIPLVVFGFVQPSPTGMMPASAEVKGIKRITRHPVNMGIAAFALAHLLANGHLGNAAFFGALFVVGFFGAYHQDTRKSLKLGESFKTFKEQTSVFPFAAILRGKTKLEIGELNKPILLGSFALYLLLIIFHAKLFGASPF